MVTVATCGDINEAVRLRMALEAHGISAFIPDENMARIHPPIFLTSSGVRVQVAEKDATAAQKVISKEAKS